MQVTQARKLGDALAETADLYRQFAVQAAGASPLYAELAARTALDEELLGFLAFLPVEKRAPTLVFAALRYVGGTPEDFGGFRDRLFAQAGDIVATIRERVTQTNEVARCGPMLPLLSGLPQPLALIEVGTSAGLCLYPDRYHYDFGLTSLGPVESSVQLSCVLEGAVAAPTGLPEIAWRAGIDQQPLDVLDEDDVRWLECLIWPGQEARLQRLRAAIALAMVEPPTVYAGDLNDSLPALIAMAPEDATVVVFHSATMMYLEPAQCERFAATMRLARAHWISQESADVFSEIAAKLPIPVPTEQPVFVLALDGEPRALTAPHGGWSMWW